MYYNLNTFKKYGLIFYDYKYFAFNYSIYISHKYIVAWIIYYNNTDERFGNSIWRWTYDYKVLGKRDVSDLDDKPFVRKRRIRNRTVSLMYCNFSLVSLFLCLL